MYKIKCFNNSIDKQQSFERHCSDTHTDTRTLCAWDGKNQVTEESQIHDYQSINRFRTGFFCKLGNKIWFLLVVCINGAYEAQ